MSVESLLETLTRRPPFRDFVTHVEERPARTAREGWLAEPLAPPLARYLAQRGLVLRTHQAQAIAAIRAGRHVLLSTPPASGKTLAFNLPIWERLLADPEATALYLYPTKALAQDQWTSLTALAAAVPARVLPAVYDGDTPPGQRARIRAQSRLVLSNFYMLHQTLGWAHQWERFWSHLAFVVIDEAHVYRGVFGSNAALVVRRLARLLDAVGAAPQYVLASATLANAAELAERLTGVDPSHLDVIDDDGSARGQQHFVFYNPEALGRGLASPHQETARILAAGVAHGVQTLAFAVSRQLAELVARQARALAAAEHAPFGDQVAPYRAGYLPSERRALEGDLRSGRIRGLVSTNALELGVDIGSLGAVVLSGFPGTMVSVRQQAGRAGRGEDASLVVWVPFADPLDQYLARRPAVFFGRPHEHAVIDLGNPYILSGHLLCAAAERPLDRPAARRFFGPAADGVLDQLQARGLLRETPRGLVYQSRPAAHQVVALDATGMQATVKVLREGDGGEAFVLETMDWTRALSEAHPGAVLLHGAKTHVVSSLDLTHYVATVKRQRVDYWTEPMKSVVIHILDERDTREHGELKLSWGDVEVTEQVVGYKTRRGDEVVAQDTVDLPPVTYRTRALWFTLPEAFSRQRRLERANLPGGLHGAEHALASLMPLWVLCDRRDLGALSVWHHPDTGAATIFIHEHAEGGIGLTERGFDRARALAEATHALVRDCPCQAGCPSCVYSPTCSSDNLPMDKSMAIEVLAQLVEIPPDPE